MTWVKLCGMTRRADVEAAAALGADAVGFVVYEGSSRRIDLDTAAILGRGLALERYLVTVDAAPDRLLADAERAAVTGVQPHGKHALEAAGAARRAGLTVLFPVPVRGEAVDLGGVPDHSIPILDTHDAGHGGTGRSFDWSLARDLRRPWVLAGGLGPGTVAEAVRLLEPWGVDVASGIEAAPGVKDPDLMRAFLEAVR